MRRFAIFLVLSIVLLSEPLLAAGVRVEFPGRKLAAQRKGKRVDYMHLRPGETLTVRATGPRFVNLRVCRVFLRGKLPSATGSLVVARDDGKVARAVLKGRPRKDSPRPFDRNLEMSKRVTWQIKVPEGDHIFVVTTDPGAGQGLAVRVTKSKKARKKTLEFVEPSSLPAPVAATAVEPAPTAPTETLVAQPTASTTTVPEFKATDPALLAPKPGEGAQATPKPAPGDEEFVVVPDRAANAMTLPSEAEEERGGVHSAVFWTTASAAVVAALASGGMKVWHRQEQAAYDKKVREDAPAFETRETRDRMVVLERAYIGFAGAAGLAAVVATIVAIFTDWDGNEDDPVSLTPLLAPDAGGISVGFEF